MRLSGKYPRHRRWYRVLRQISRADTPPQGQEGRRIRNHDVALAPSAAEDVLSMWQSGTHVTVVPATAPAEIALRQKGPKK